MKNPNPSDTTSTGIPAARARSANGTNAGSCGCAAAFAAARRGRRVISPTSQAISLREPDEPGVVRRDVRLPVRGHELGHERVGDVGLGDRPVVVDENRDRRLPGSSGGTGRRPTGERRVGQRWLGAVDAGHRRG